VENRKVEWLGSPKAYNAAAGSAASSEAQLCKQAFTHTELNRENAPENTTLLVQITHDRKLLDINMKTQSVGYINAAWTECALVRSCLRSPPDLRRSEKSMKIMARYRA
jgi:hypothetical protein